MSFLFRILTWWFPPDGIPKVGTFWKAYWQKGMLDESVYQINAVNKDWVEYALKTREPDGTGLPCIPQPPNSCPRRDFLSDFYPA